MAKVTSSHWTNQLVNHWFSQLKLPFARGLHHFQTQPYFKTRVIFWHNICIDSPQIPRGTLLEVPRSSLLPFQRLAKRGWLGNPEKSKMETSASAFLGDFPAMFDDTGGSKDHLKKKSWTLEKYWSFSNKTYIYIKEFSPTTSWLWITVQKDLRNSQLNPMKMVYLRTNRQAMGLFKWKKKRGN